MRYVVVVDVPGIKHFVFGTKAAAEIRGASALLVRLNQHETEPHFRQRLERAGGRLERTVYTNGGKAQFLVEVPEREALLDALAELSRLYREQTGGEVRLAFGYAPFEETARYDRALRAAFDQLQARRETAHGHRTVELLPFMRECDSSSHLPAQEVVDRPEERLLLSRASKEKRDEIGRQRRSGSRHDLWSQWMSQLHSAGEWPEPGQCDKLRYREFSELAEESRPAGSLALVYADGNAMGRIVQELDSPEVASTFSKLVDESIRSACFDALNSVCASEIERIHRRWQIGETKLGQIPADILLLGGDDLLVLLPADRALRFAARAMDRFEALTHEAIDGLPEGAERDFFTTRLGSRGLTISCGVAIARATYPFALLFELAESLLKSAKVAGTAASCDPHWAPSYIDFHQVSGPSSFDLAQVRQEDYRTQTSNPRTLRPLSIHELGRLEESVLQLRRAGFPRSKMHDLFEAALAPQATQATWRVRELFSRCKQTERFPQRRMLWEAVAALTRGDSMDFPWSGSASNGALPIADLVEAHDLFPEEVAS